MAKLGFVLFLKIATPPHKFDKKKTFVHNVYINAYNF
jgi:hypothetical protein